MAKRRVATVFGASGFIGRALVRKLADLGFVVRAAGRDMRRAGQLRPLGDVGQVVPLYAPLDKPADIARAVEGAEIVVNLVGLLAERRAGDFDRVHRAGAGLIADKAYQAGVPHLVHVSAIGADTGAASRYARSKGAGEAEVRKAYPEATILRPSIVFGPEDDFFNRFGTMTTLLPFLPVIEGETRFQPVYVGDVASAIIAATQRPEARGQIYELGGPDVMSFRQILEYILRETHRHRTLVEIPRWAAGLQASILEMLPGKKLLTRDQLVLLRQDNVVHSGMKGLEELGITPTPMRLIVPAYLVRFRPGGRLRAFDPGYS